MLNTTTAPKPRTSDQRRLAFVDAGREAFFSRGYGGTSMSAISAAVGGSKTTLWTYFPSKELLYAAVVDDLIERYDRGLATALDPGVDVAEALTRFARALLDTLHSPPIIDLHRLIIGEAGRFPELAWMMYARGPARGKLRLKMFFEQAMDAGRLRRGDAATAARHLSGMLQIGSVQQHMLGLIPKPAETVLQQEADSAVDTIMRAWSA